MKKIFLTLVGLMVFSISAFAEQGATPAAQKDQMPKMNMMMCDPAVMGANCPMAKPATPPASDATSQMAPGKCTMADMKCPMNSMMRSMVDVMKMQGKVLAGVPSAEKKKMVAEIDKKIAALETGIDNMQKMPMPCMSQMPCMQPNAPAAPQAPAK
ncbi:MAG: hypothetical protein HGB00_00015 [Chlorobiaceae bacterium]|nr:hypothetical protein [Chlorobiaceae bacterium]